MSGLTPLLKLPLELRQQIYSYLILEDPVSHPIPAVGITSVSHTPPAAHLLVVNRQLKEELQDYYFAMARWKLIFSHAFNFFRVDPTLAKLESWTLLSRIQKVEMVFFCDILLLKEYPSFGLDNFCAEIKRRAARACEVLQSAKDLRHITISWIDTTDTGAWKDKAAIVGPLMCLSDTVQYQIGEITGPEGPDQVIFVGAIRKQLDMS